MTNEEIKVVVFNAYEIASRIEKVVEIKEGLKSLCENTSSEEELVDVPDTLTRILKTLEFDLIDELHSLVDDALNTRYADQMCMHDGGAGKSVILKAVQEGEEQNG